MLGDSRFEITQGTVQHHSGVHEAEAEQVEGHFRDVPAYNWGMDQ